MSLRSLNVTVDAVLVLPDPHLIWYVDWHFERAACPLDMNWRASASGPASDRSSTSGSEGRKTAAADRADRDSNWRDHEAVQPVSQHRKPQSRQSLEQAKQGKF